MSIATAGPGESDSSRYPQQMYETSRSPSARSPRRGVWQNSQWSQPDFRRGRRPARDQPDMLAWDKDTPLPDFHHDRGKHRPRTEPRSSYLRPKRTCSTLVPALVRFPQVTAVRRHAEQVSASNGRSPNRGFDILGSYILKAEVKGHSTNTGHAADSNDTGYPKYGESLASGSERQGEGWRPA